MKSYTLVTLALLAILLPNSDALGKGKVGMTCTPIESVPKTIAEPGTYCLASNLEYFEGSGNAITINANDVTIDLDGRILDGLSAGPATLAVGVFADQRENIVIRNGTIRGFLRAIQLSGYPPFTVSRGHLIEEIRAERNTQEGINIAGEGSIIRDSQISDTGGSTVESHARGIFLRGSGVRAINNDISNTFAAGSDSAYAVLLSETYGAVVENNRINSVSGNSGTNFLGIHTVNSFGLLIVDNRISDSYYGIFFYGNTGKYMNNLTTNVAVPYTGGLAVGANN